MTREIYLFKKVVQMFPTLFFTVDIRSLLMQILLLSNITSILKPDHREVQDILDFIKSTTERKFYLHNLLLLVKLTLTSLVYSIPAFKHTL